jgi:putative phage-type endonuclease
MTSAPTSHPEVGERKGYIGGSDLAAILSLSPYGTPFQVFCAKVGVEVAERNDPVREEKFYFGHHLEEAIARAVTERYGIPAERTPEKFYRHPKYPFMGGHLDFWWSTTKRAVIECKNIEFRSNEWGEDSLEEDCSGRVPLYYLCQVDHYMAIMDAQVAYLCALFGGCRLCVYRIDRSPEREALVIAAEGKFWQRVLNDDPPPFNGFDDMIAAIRSGYIESYNAKRAKELKKIIQLDAVANELLSRAYAASRKAAAAKAERDVARSALVQHLGGATGYLYIDKEKQGSLLTHERESFDEFSMKLAHPDIHAKFATKMLVGPTLRLSKDRIEEEKDE